MTRRTTTSPSAEGSAHILSTAAKEVAKAHGPDTVALLVVQDTETNGLAIGHSGGLSLANAAHLALTTAFGLFSAVEVAGGSPRIGVRDVSPGIEAVRRILDGVDDE